MAQIYRIVQVECKGEEKISEKRKEKYWKAWGKIKYYEYLKVNKCFPVCLFSFRANLFMLLYILGREDN